jgi:hypothetical protein
MHIPDFKLSNQIYENLYFARKITRLNDACFSGKEKLEE